jgi:hypothetical protein
MRKLPLIAGAALCLAVPYVCQQMNFAHELMVGSNESVDRSSPIVP